MRNGAFARRVASEIGHARRNSDTPSCLVRCSGVDRDYVEQVVTMLEDEKHLVVQYIRDEYIDVSWDPAPGPEALKAAEDGKAKGWRVMDYSLSNDSVRKAARRALEGAGYTVTTNESHPKTLVVDLYPPAKDAPPPLEAVPAAPPSLEPAVVVAAPDAAERPVKRTKAE